ncbi:MAG: cob(I)yrinic acid a,c-diamide adenosyltransferase [Verrucomicrobiota bacterium]
MSIVTRTGDKGTTALMYGRRVLKSHARVEAYGVVDELNASLGVARAAAADPGLRENLLFIQKELVTLMGELAVAAEDLERYVKDGYALVTPEMGRRLEQQVFEMESSAKVIQGWATPGATPGAAALDLARTVCRRAERRVSALLDDGQLRNQEVLIYLNRLADWLWLAARLAQGPPGRE